MTMKAPGRPEDDVDVGSLRAELTRVRKGTIRAHLLEGMTAEDIAIETGWGLGEIRKIVREVLAEEEREIVGRRPEDIFTAHVLESRKRVRILDRVVEDLRDPEAEYGKSRQGAAIVGAIRTQHQITKELIEIGQEMDLIRKAPDRHLFMGITSDMSVAQLKEVLAGQIQDTNGLLARFGDQDVLALREPARLLTPAVVDPDEIDVDISCDPDETQDPEPDSRPPEPPLKPIAPKGPPPPPKRSKGRIAPPPAPLDKVPAPPRGYRAEVARDERAIKTARRQGRAAA